LGEDEGGKENIPPQHRRRRLVHAQPAAHTRTYRPSPIESHGRQPEGHDNRFLTGPGISHDSGFLTGPIQSQHPENDAPAIDWSVTSHSPGPRV
jgi:hypothetical protein